MLCHVNDAGCLMSLLVCSTGKVQRYQYFFIPQISVKNCDGNKCTIIRKAEISSH